MKNFILFLLSILFLGACTYKNEWHQIPIQNKFSVELPDYMTESKKLRADASLQYENRYRNTYIIIIEQDKKDMSFSDFVTKSINPLTKYLDKPAITDSIDITVNGLPTRLNKIMGEMESGDDKENIYYTHYSINGKKKYYEVCTWTRGPKRLDQYGKDLQRMMDSFKEM